jgi:NAD(P)-dependent dehydrogenase (short-subunit alcohol dehydrogenase family)
MADKLDGKVVLISGATGAERIFTTPADVAQADGVRDLVEGIVARFERVDVLLNTVGGWSGGKPLGETPVEEWDRLLALNLRSAFLLSRAVLPLMLKSGWGRIVHVSSKTAVAPRARQAGYAVAKMGVITLTEVIAAEVKGTGVTANVILPSIIDTPANRDAMPKADPRKWVEPARIAATMRFLCSDDAASINGARIPIYGAV